MIPIKLSVSKMNDKIDQIGQLNVVPNSNSLGIKRFVPAECYIITQIQCTKPFLYIVCVSLGWQGFMHVRSLLLFCHQLHRGACPRVFGVVWLTMEYPWKTPTRRGCRAGRRKQSHFGASLSTSSFQSS